MRQLPGSAVCTMYCFVERQISGRVFLLVHASSVARDST